MLAITSAVFFLVSKFSKQVQVILVWVKWLEVSLSTGTDTRSWRSCWKRLKTICLLTTVESENKKRRKRRRLSRRGDWKFRFLQGILWAGCACTYRTDEAPASKSSRKRPATFPNDSDNESDSQEIMQGSTEQTNDEMSSILSSFGADVSKSLTAKRKRLAGFTTTAMKTSNKKVRWNFRSTANPTA